MASHINLITTLLVNIVGPLGSEGINFTLLCFSYYDVHKDTFSLVRAQGYGPVVNKIVENHENSGSNLNIAKTPYHFVIFTLIFGG